MNREEFRREVFKRDNYKCIICGRSDHLDAHHIIERRLWDDGGYYLDNGASLCAEHHLQAEQTILTCDRIREVAGITNILLPEHLYTDQSYDKWGNIILSNGQRIRGELAYDESVRKILTGVEFSKYVKYPRTYHLPWSLGIGKDDRVLKNTSCFENKEIIISVKMDGENTSLYSDYVHARSLDSEHHPSQDWVRRFHANISYNIPEGWRICGENLYAQHTIPYNNLDDYFLVYSIWDEYNRCLSWEDTETWCGLLGIKHVPIIYTGLWNEDIKNLKVDFEVWEGYVVRLAGSFPYSAFRHSIAKFVREEFKDHIDSHHWKSKQIVPNKLKKDFV